MFLTDRTKFVLLEIQIRTIAMDFWATLEHKMYYKYDKEMTQDLAIELKDAAETFQYLDQKMEAINNHTKHTAPKVIPLIPRK